MDAVLVILVLILSVISVVGVRLLREGVINPVTIIIPTFFAPMLAATSRLSSLQSSSWQYETYVVMILVAFSWLFFPLLVFIANGVNQRKGMLDGGGEFKSLVFDVFSNYKIIFYSRITWCAVVGSYFVSNLAQAHQLIITDPEFIHRLHSDFPFGLRFFARATPVAVMLCYFTFLVNRKKLDFVFMLVALMIPLTRGSRIDVALSLVTLCILFTKFPMFKLSKKKLVFIGLLLSALIVGGVEYGNQRLNRFGLYSVTYDKVIGWRSDIVGPSMIFPTLYAYFPLSFENFDQFVAQTHGRTYGVMSFDWFLTGFAKANWIPGYSQLLANASYTPVSSGANVPTTLMPFYSDFGAIGSVFPMIMCMSFWLYAYQKSKKSLPWFGVFAIYSAAFSLTSFQGLIVSPIVAQQLVEVSIIIYMFRRYVRNEKCIVVKL